MTFDMYGQKAADAMALIREFAKAEYYHYFARDYEGSLEQFVAMLDQAEEKGQQEQAARIAELERENSSLAYELNVSQSGGSVAILATTPSAPAVERQPVATFAQIEKFLSACLKPEEISGPERNERLQELMCWFSRFLDGHANPKWFRAHAYELCYAIATMPLYIAPQAADTDKVREAIDRLPDEIMNLRCTRTMSHFATTDDMKLYKEGHRDARHAAVELVLSAVWGAPSHEVPADWKLVPVSITEDMHVAAVKAIIRSTGNDDCPPNVWKAMLAAAPVASMAAQAPVREVPEGCEIFGWIIVNEDTREHDCGEVYTDKYEADDYMENRCLPGWQLEPIYRVLPAAPVKQGGE